MSNGLLDLYQLSVGNIFPVSVDLCSKLSIRFLVLCISCLYQSGIYRYFRLLLFEGLLTHLTDHDLELLLFKVVSWLGHLEVFPESVDRRLHASKRRKTLCKKWYRCGRHQ